jgi:3-oxoadipate enol-lactonase
MQMKTSVHGTSINYEDAGQGLPVILLHGFPLDHRMWRNQVEALHNAYRVITPDLRGMGGSDVPKDNITLDHYADDILALMDQLEIEQAVLGGFSMGGYIAFSLMRKAPKRFSALILADTRPEADSQEGRKNRMIMAAALLDKGAVAAKDAMLPKLLSENTQQAMPKLVEELDNMISSMAPVGLVHACLSMAFRQDSISLLPSIDVPTLVIVGEKDVITPPEVMKQMADHIPNSLFVRIPNAAHMSPMESPAAFNTALLEFLKDLNGC